MEDPAKITTPPSPVRPSLATRIGATTFLGVVGIVFTGAQIWMVHNKDDFDRKSKEFDVIISLFQKCASDVPADQSFANRFIGVQARTSIAHYNNYFSNDAIFNQALVDCSKLVSDIAANTKPPPDSLVSPPTELPDSASKGTSESPARRSGPDTPSASPNDGPRFWIYLGTYDGNQWKTKYLDLPSDFVPATYAIQADPRKGEYRVLAARPLNVRYGTFSSTGDFPPPTSTLKPGQMVTIRSTAQWFDSGNWWATIVPLSTH